MFGDKEIRLSTHIIPNTEQLLNDLDALLKNASTSEEYLGIQSARLLVKQAIMVGEVSLVISREEIEAEDAPNMLMLRTVNKLKLDLMSRLIEDLNLTVVSEVFDKEI